MSGGPKTTVTVPRLVIAAPCSGSGKSTLAIGLMAALAEDSVVQGFKVGPDYIDPGYHTAACGRPSRNLDSWMTSPAEVRRTFARAAAGADIAVVEGVMGLYDGDGDSIGGNSTAQVAKLLRAPVILVINVGKMAHSAGAMALGFRDFDPTVNVAAAVCNNVAGSRHATWAREAIESVGIPVLGCLPRSQALGIPERHLGLVTAGERLGAVEDLLARLTAAVRADLNLGRVWDIARTAEPFAVAMPDAVQTGPRVRLAVARDEAFCFYYEDNLDLLRLAGAEVVFFSPLRDARLPEGTAGIYLGGGYPELYAPELAANTSLLAEVRQARQRGLPVYAECGGLMYLCEGIVDGHGQMQPLAGLLPGRCRLADRLTMGYRIATALRPSLLLPEGAKVRGHEFHYSEWLDMPEPRPSAYVLEGRGGAPAREEGWVEEGLLASYLHLHFASHPALAPRFVAACRAAQGRSAVGECS